MLEAGGCRRRGSGPVHVQWQIGENGLGKTGQLRHVRRLPAVVSSPPDRSLNGGSSTGIVEGAGGGVGWP